MFNNVLDAYETFFGNKKLNVLKSQKFAFFKVVNPCFWSKSIFLIFFICFGKIISRNNV